MSAEKTTENFWKAWNGFVWPEIRPVQYRLYYKSDGSPLVYSMEDSPGDWIEVSQQIYIAAPWNVRVVDGELKIIPIAKTYHKLRPSDHGVACDPRDVCVIVSESSSAKICWSLQSHEIS